MTRKCRKGGGRGENKELNSTMIAPPRRQHERPLTTSIKESVSTIKRGYRVLEKLSPKMLIAEGGFETMLSLINSTRKWLVYLKGEINGTNVSMLVDTKATNSFITPTSAERLKMEVVDTALSIKVNFAQGSCQAAQISKGVRLKAGAAKFEEDFTICDLGGVDVVL